MFNVPRLLLSVEVVVFEMVPTFVCNCGSSILDGKGLFDKSNGLVLIDSILDGPNNNLHVFGPKIPCAGVILFFFWKSITAFFVFVPNFFIDY
jgi:hypothetical protein